MFGYLHPREVDDELYKPTILMPHRRCGAQAVPVADEGRPRIACRDVVVDRRHKAAALWLRHLYKGTSPRLIWSALSTLSIVSGLSVPNRFTSLLLSTDRS